MSCEDDDDEVFAIVIDNGSGFCKAGFAGDECPQSNFPTLIGRRITGGGGGDDDDDAVYIGEDAKDNEQHNSIITSSPIDRGIITNWDDMEQIWHYTFYTELRVNNNNKAATEQQYPVLLTECPMNPKANRERMVQIIFDIFAIHMNIPAIYIANQSVLSLYSYGQTTGCVIDSGYSITHIVPIYEGYTIPHGIIRIELGGKDVTNYLKQILVSEDKPRDNDGLSLLLTDDSLPSVQQEILLEIKESYCYVALDFEEEMKKITTTATDTGTTTTSNTPESSSSSVEISYELPNGTKVRIGKECFCGPEVLFQPKKFGLLDGGDENDDDTMDDIGIGTSTFQSIMKCDNDIHDELLQNIIVTGGNMKFRGMKERLHKEISTHLNNVNNNNTTSSTSPAILEPPDSGHYNYSAWLGGSILSSLSTFQSMWISKEEYDEFGPSIVHSKCNL